MPNNKKEDARREAACEQVRLGQMTLAQVAKQLGLHPQTLRTWAAANSPIPRGKAGRPKKAVVEQAARPAVDPANNPDGLYQDILERKTSLAAAARMIDVTKQCLSARFRKWLSTRPASVQSAWRPVRAVDAGEQRRRALLAREVIAGRLELTSAAAQAGLAPATMRRICNIARRAPK